jgi:imidazolonepropionase-like amidohydrolase
MPGLVDLHSGAGLPRLANEESSELTPSWRALDAVDPQSEDFALAAESGITTVVLAPSGRSVIGGLAAAVKTSRAPLAQRVVDGEVALTFGLGLEPALGNRTPRFQQPQGTHFRRPGNRMGGVAEIRRALAAARAGAPGDDPDALRRVLAGRLPAWFIARTENDARTALRLAGEMGVRPVLLEAHEAHRLAADLAPSAAAVVLGPEYEEPRTLIENVEGRDARPAAAAILHEAGVVVALATGPGDDPAGLRDRAILAVRHGMPRDAALASVTSVPAHVIGQDGRLGTLSGGASADLVLLDGDPLSPATRVVAVLIDGVRAQALPGPETP